MTCLQHARLTYTIRDWQWPYEFHYRNLVLKNCGKDLRHHTRLEAIYVEEKYSLANRVIFWERATMDIASARIDYPKLIQ